MDNKPDNQPAQAPSPARVVPGPQASARNTEMGQRFDKVLFEALDAVEAQKIPYALIGGIAISGMGRPRSTHDIDLFVRPEDAEATLEALVQAGFEAERPELKWLLKAWKEDHMVDIIHRSQGDIYFDPEMQSRAKNITFHGRQIPAVPPEDLIIIKASVHQEVGPHHWWDALALLTHAQIDWDYLLKRARKAPRRLLSLLIYAQSQDVWIPNTVVNHLFDIIYKETRPPGSDPDSVSPLLQAAPQAQQKPQSSIMAQQVAQPIADQAAPRVPSSQTKTADAAKVATSANRHTLLNLDTPLHQGLPATYVVGHLYELLAADCRTASLDCELAVGGNRVLVKGEIQTQDQHDAINDVINRAAPDFDVENQTRVTALRPLAPAEEVI